MYVIFVIGGPACGKSSLCKSIIDHYNHNHNGKKQIRHISVGELLKKEIASGSENGKLIINFINQSIIVPAELTFSLLLKELEFCRTTRETQETQILLIDGYPRDKENKDYFDNHKPQFLNVLKVLYIECDKNIMMERSNRRSASNGLNGEIRFDDSIKIIEERIKVFFSVTMNVIQEYNDNSADLLLTVDGSKTPDEILHDVIRDIPF